MKENNTENLALWEDILMEVYRLPDFELINKLKDAEPKLAEQLLKDARIWLAEAIYGQLKD